MHTIDPKMLIAWGDVLAFGAAKYHQRNFLVAPGMAWGRVYDSLQGHLQAFWAGEWLDEESGLPHLAHVMCNLQFLWTYHEHNAYHYGDDRPSSVEYAGRSYAEWEAHFKMASMLREPFNPDPVPDFTIEPGAQIKTPIPDILGGLARSRGKPGSPDRLPYHNNGREMGLQSAKNRARSLIDFCGQNNKASTGVCLADIELLHDAYVDAGGGDPVVRQLLEQSKFDAQGEEAKISTYALSEVLKVIGEA